MTITLTSEEFGNLFLSSPVKSFGDPLTIDPPPLPPVGPPPPPPIDPCAACDPCKDAPGFAFTYCEDGRTQCLAPPAFKAFPVYDPTLPGWGWEPA